MPDTLTVSRRLTLTNKRGLHARASNKFVARAEEFDAEIKVKSHNEIGAHEVIADSALELMLLGSAFGEDITVSATGADAEDALRALTELVENRFGEEQ